MKCALAIEGILQPSSNTTTTNSTDSGKVIGPPAELTAERAVTGQSLSVRREAQCQYTCIAASIRVCDDTYDHRKQSLHQPRTNNHQPTGAAELYVEEATLKQDLGSVLLDLELRQATLIRQRVARQVEPEPSLTEAERTAALELLQDPQLISRILADYAACGLVGEETNKLVCYLACVSRLLPQPLSVLIQSSSAAGKTSLLEATLAFLPAAAQRRWSALTGQSLYYLGRDELRHKVLAVAEEEGVTQASYALKLLQSEGRLALAVASKTRDSGRSQTECYEVEGPVALLLTTTRDEPDPELANRCLVLSVNEDATHTAAIHTRQRAAYSRAAEEEAVQALRRRQQHAQQALEPLGVVIPWADQLTFRSDQTRYRRDHAKYLTLIAASALLHQYQRARTTRLRNGQSEVCVVATPADLELANRLATATLAPQVEALLPQTRQLWEQLCAYGTERAAAQQIPAERLRFSQRELRAALGWPDRTLRRNLMRLVELEYVVMHRTGCGNQRAYQLCAAQPALADSSLGLTQVVPSARRTPR